MYERNSCGGIDPKIEKWTSVLLRRTVVADFNRFHAIFCNWTLLFVPKYGSRPQHLLMIFAQLNWLAWNLDQFMRSTGEKTLNLPHGILKLRLGRDKIKVADFKQFLDVLDNQKFLKSIPETYQPDVTRTESKAAGGGRKPKHFSETC